jgi:hypothetical protein
MPTSSSAIAWNLRAGFLVGVLFVGSLAAGQAPVLYGASPGKANAEIQGTVLSLANDMIRAQWSVAEGKLTARALAIRTTGAQASLPRDPFSFTFKDGTTVHASDMIMIGSPQIEDLPSNAGASRTADHFAGKAITLRLQYQATGFLAEESRENQNTNQGAKKGVSVVWRAVLRDDSNYIREEISLSAPDDDQPITEVSLFNGNLPGASVVGTVKGSPVTAGDLFLGFENPLAQCQETDKVTCAIRRELPLRKGQTVDYSLVIGVSPPGQVRRGFLNYVERERAHPYRTFLHYNSWYDIGFGKPYDAAAVLDVINAFGTELVRCRNVKLDSFLLDDGWDNPHSTWQMNPGFPEGLTPLTRAAQQ